MPLPCSYKVNNFLLNRLHHMKGILMISQIPGERKSTSTISTDDDSLGSFKDLPCFADPTQSDTGTWVYLQHYPCFVDSTQ